MARARNIKPGFFSNDALVELPFETRLLFIGLWTLADREGRLEDRPKRIRAQLFAYDAVNCDEMLDALAAAGFIERYSVDGFKCVQIINFLKHQVPHHKEAASELPAPDGRPAITRHPYDVSPQRRSAIFARDGMKCLKCGSEESLSLDHIRPLVAGGTNDDENLQTLCKRCNSSKGDATKDYRRVNVDPTLPQRSADVGGSCPSDSLIPDSPSLIPDSSSLRSPRAFASPAELTKAMREAGVEAQPADPRVMKLAEQGVSPETARAACDSARSKKPGQRISPGYVFAILEGWAADAASMNAHGARSPPARAPPVDKLGRQIAMAAELTGRNRPQDDAHVIDADATPATPARIAFAGGVG